MKANPVNWFEIPVTDLGRARKFYDRVFQTTLTDLPMPNMEMAAFPMEEGAINATGCIIKTEGYEPSKVGTIVYFSCEDLDATLKRVEDAGGEVMVPRMSIGEFGYIAHFVDSEGNRVALHSDN